MKNLKANGCCFCFTLRTGGLILGWLYTVFGFLGCSIIFGSLAILLSINPDSDIIFIGDRAIIDKPTLIKTFSISGLYLLLAAVSGILLIIAIKQSRHKKMIMFMIVTIIGSVLITYDIYVYSRSGLYNQVFKKLVSLALNNYFLFVVNSLYVKIKNGDKLSQVTLA
ncbi:hypothetical protein ACKWTF_001869 [Chironomus riparius]